MKEPCGMKMFLAALAGVCLLLATSTAGAAPPIGTADTVTADPPVSRPSTTPCVVKLFSGYKFADFTPKTFSYAGPPASCKGPWAKVVFSADFSVTAGRQYDRTASIWVGGASIYFGTTQEPSRTVSPAWHVERDLTDYSALFAAAQPGQVEIGNLVNMTYTGVISGSAELIFYPVERHARAPRTPDAVLPLSAGASGGAVGLGSTTSRLAQTFTLPSNVERAVLDVYAQSQSGDEFWYTCVPSDVSSTVQSCGATAFREAQVTIDGQPAGVAPIYPWIYTGGIDPYLWRPIPGVQTLQFVPYRVDLTPFAGVLSNGKPHEVAVSVFNANNYFAATASLLLYRDPGAARVTGAVTMNTLHASPSPKVQEKLDTATAGVVTGTVSVGSSRRFVIAGYVETSHGRVRTEVSQDIRFSSVQSFDIDAAKYVQDIKQRTWVESITKTHQGFGLPRETVQHFEWPLDLSFASVTNPDGTSSQTTSVRQAYESRELTSVAGFPVHFSTVSNTVAPKDTLTFDAGGAFTGNKDLASSQHYFSADSGGACYSKEIKTSGGLTTSITTGDDC